jgi:hypothetical protein
MYALLCFIFLDNPVAPQAPVSIHPQASKAKSEPIANVDYLQQTRAQVNSTLKTLTY